MNLDSKYKFVDECKDKLDQILDLIELDMDKTEFKDKFFEQVDGLAVSEMYKSLSEDKKQEVLPILQSNNELDVIEKFLPLFDENTLRTIYVKGFETLVQNMFKGSEYDSIQDQIQVILSTEVDSEVPATNKLV